MDFIILYNICKYIIRVKCQLSNVNLYTPISIQKKFILCPSPKVWKMDSLVYITIICVFFYFNKNHR